MQSTINMFSVKVDKFRLTNIDNDMLVNHAIELPVPGRYVCGVNEYGESWQSADKKLHELNKLKSFFSIVEDKINQVYRASYSKNYKVKISFGWCSVNNPYDLTTPHNHKESFLSAVYYPRANNEELWFLTPIPQMLWSITSKHVEKYDEYNSDYWSEIVNTGDLLIFNSMLWHFIKPSEKQRISFAVDSVIENN